MKTYIRNLGGMNSKQILIVSDNGKFESIWNGPIGSHQIIGFCPVEFEEGEDVPRGFLKKYGFRRFYPSEHWTYWYNQRLEMLSDFGERVTGNFTGKW